MYYDQSTNIKKGDIEQGKELMKKITQLQKQNENDYQCNAKSEYELVQYITTTIKRDENFEDVVRFYKKNDFIDLNDEPVWRDIVSMEQDPNLLILVRVGPKTCAEICAQDEE